MDDHEPAADAASAPPGSSADAAEVPQLLARAWVLAVTSALRGWARTAEIWARRGTAVAEGLRELGSDGLTPPDARAALIDELRAGLRELAEVPAEEARHLQAELERLLDSLRPAAPEERGSPYRRRWNVKP